MLSGVRCFKIMLFREGLTFLTKITVLTVTEKKKYTGAFSGFLFLQNTRKNCKLNRVLAVVLGPVSRKSR